MNGVKSTAVASAFALALGMAVFPATSHADTVTYVQNSDHCTNGCGINTSNTIVVSNVGTGASTSLFTITVNMAAGFDPVNTGFPVTLGFSSTLANLTLNATTGYTAVGPLRQADPVTPRTWMVWGSFQRVFMDGYGTKWRRPRRSQQHYRIHLEYRLDYDARHFYRYFATAKQRGDTFRVRCARIYWKHGRH